MARKKQLKSDFLFELFVVSLIALMIGFITATPIKKNRVESTPISDISQTVKDVKWILEHQSLNYIINTGGTR